MNLTDEIIDCGIVDGSSIIHFGAGHKNGEFLKNLYDSITKRGISTKYVGVEADSEKIKSTMENLLKSDVPTTYQNIINAPMQDYIVDNTEKYDFAVISGIFDKNVYEDNQFQFIHSVINEMFNFVEHSIIFTYNSYEHQEEMYNVHYINGYVHNNYNSYSIMRINEHEYLYCINKYYFSYNI